MNNLQASVSSGLSVDVWRVGASETGPWYISAQTNMIQPSALILTISQSGSQSVSISSAPATSLQSSISLQKALNCAAGDLITVTVTSSAPVDQPPNTIKTTITCRNSIT